jgi:predicted nucleic acid-binding protein
MTRLLVDTNVISEILRAVPDPNVVRWSQQLAKQNLFLSVISMGELRKGLTILPPSSRRTQLEKSIEEQIPVWFAERLLPVTQSIAEKWGVLDGQRQLAGRPLNVPDGQIAATALEHGLTVATRNVKDFEGLGVSILNPWEVSVS